MESDDHYPFPIYKEGKKGKKSTLASLIVCHDDDTLFRIGVLWYRNRCERKEILEKERYCKNERVMLIVIVYNKSLEKKREHFSGGN